MGFLLWSDQVLFKCFTYLSWIINHSFIIMIIDNVPSLSTLASDSQTINFWHLTQSLIMVISRFSCKKSFLIIPVFSLSPFSNLFLWTDSFQSYKWFLKYNHKDIMAFYLFIYCFVNVYPVFSINLSQSRLCS